MLLPGYKIQTGLCWVFVIKLLAYFLPKEICSHISFIFPSYFLHISFSHAVLALQRTQINVVKSKDNCDFFIVFSSFLTMRMM